LYFIHFSSLLNLKMFDFRYDAKKLVHMHPYHYSLVHQSPGVPLTEVKGVYMMEEPPEDQDNLGEGGLVGTKFSKGTSHAGKKNG
jgi:hypothetical protein